MPITPCVQQPFAELQNGLVLIPCTFALLNLCSDVCQKEGRRGRLGLHTIRDLQGTIEQNRGTTTCSKMRQIRQTQQLAIRKVYNFSSGNMLSEKNAGRMVQKWNCTCRVLQRRLVFAFVASVKSGGQCGPSTDHEEGREGNQC